MKFVVAIDGPAAAGKGTISKAVAERFGFAYLDTGLLYRAVGRKALDQGRGVIDEGLAELVARELSEADLAQPDSLRTALVAKAASRVAAMPGVRAALLEFQRRFSQREGGAVLDGRDIGTVICPLADVKIYVTASDEARAERRWKELTDRGEETTLERVLTEQRARDERDSGRGTAPLRKADDAELLDTTGLTIEQAVDRAASIVEAALASRR